MNEAPYKRSSAGEAPGPDERFGLPDPDLDTGADGPSAKTQSFGPQTDPESQPTQVFSSDYQAALPERYRLIQLIGRGGMAEVFLAKDVRLNRRVAIKFLSGEFRRDPDRTRRFSQEARAASALNHPNILIIHDISENDGIQFIVSEYVDGETLGSRIRREKIPLVKAVDIAIQIASALAASHNAGIVHRDVKPDNIMLRPDGSVKVLDFGLAKETGQILSINREVDARTLDRLSTSPGLILGTPQYMSPEQTRGSQLDARTDIFSLGNIIFEMVTGTLPFPGKSVADIIAAIISKEPRRLEEFLVDPPVKLIGIVDKALRKNPDERYSRMEHLQADLTSLQQELMTQPYGAVETGRVEGRDTGQETIQSVVTRRSVPWGAIAMLLVVAGIGALSLWWYFGRSAGGTARVESKGTVSVTSWSSAAGESAGAASFSPDAKMVAYAATKSDATEIWTKPIGGGDPIQVTKNGFYNQYPVWSPNGQEIAFFSSRGESRGIWRAKFSGGDQVQVASRIGSAARPVKWSANGKIYYQDGSELFTVDLKTQETAQLTDFASIGETPWRIQISADESSIGYSIKEGDVWKIKTQAVGSSSSQEIARSNRQIDHLVWRPDGKSVIFSSSVDGVAQIFEATLGAGEPAQLSTGDHDLIVKDVSEDGSRILYGSVSETSDLWTVSTSDSKDSPIANGVENEFWADYSPDGQSIVYQSVIQTERPFGGSINVSSTVQGRAPIAVSRDGFSPEWSPDGRWIAFLRRSESGIALWRVRPTGDEAVKLVDGNVSPLGYTPTPYLKIGASHLAWSPDSNSIAFAARSEGVANIWLATVDASGHASLTQNADENENYCCPVWSPDGKSIAFVSGNDGGANRKGSKYRLWLKQLPDSPERILYESAERFRFLGLGSGARDAIVAQKTDAADPSSTPESTTIFSVSLSSGAVARINTLAYAYFHNIHLSPDGSSIAFVSRRDNTTTLWTVPVSGGTPRKILGENDPKVLISSLAWSPDGRSIVFGKQTRTNLLSMLTR